MPKVQMPYSDRNSKAEKLFVQCQPVAEGERKKNKKIEKKERKKFSYDAVTTSGLRSM